MTAVSLSTVCVICGVSNIDEVSLLFEDEFAPGGNYLFSRQCVRAPASRGVCRPPSRKVSQVSMTGIFSEDGKEQCIN
jgi:hypothetical protein